MRKDRGMRFRFNAPGGPLTSSDVGEPPHRLLTGPLRAPTATRCGPGQAAALALALVVAIGGCSASVGTPLGGVSIGTDGSLEGSRVGMRIGRWFGF